MRWIVFLLALTCVASAKEKIWVDRVPVGSAQQVEAYLAEVDAALPADERKVLREGLRFLGEWRAPGKSEQDARASMLSWIQGWCLLDAVLAGHVHHQTRMQNLVDELFARRMKTLASLEAKGLSQEKRVALEKESAELRTKIDLFAADRDGSDLEVLLGPAVRVAGPGEIFTSPIEQ